MSIESISAVLRKSADPHEDPSVFEALGLEEVHLDGPLEGEVLIQVAVASICHSDLSVLTGDRPRPLPMVLGHEASGVVQEIGASVSRFRPGQHVLMTFVPACGRCAYCVSSRPALCKPANRANEMGQLVTGRRPFRDRSGDPLYQHLGVSGFGSHTIVAQESLVPIDNDVSLADAALFGCAVLTGVGAVVNTARVAPGSTVAVFGCGGVGLSAILGARVVGAGRILAVDVDESKLERARELGADDTLLSSAETPDQIRDLTGGGVHYSFDATGLVEIQERAYGSTRLGGQAVVIGLAHPSARLSLSPTALVAGEKTLTGSYMGSSIPARDIPWLVELYRNGRLPVNQLVGQHLPLSAVRQGMQQLYEGSIGRQVLLVDESAGKGLCGEGSDISVPKGL